MEPITITTLVLGLAVIVLAIFVAVLNKRITALTKGSGASSLESIIKDNNKNIVSLEKTIVAHSHTLDVIKLDALNNIQNIGVVRFNPFKEAGGNQSFAIALTDKNNSGVVISSLYARERINVFAKPITKGTSEYRLSEEEQQAINKSQK